jgi:hypothetical protein
MSKVSMSNAPCSFIRLMITELRSNYVVCQCVEAGKNGNERLPVAWERDARPQISQNRAETRISAEARSTRQSHVDSPQADREFYLY